MSSSKDPRPEGASLPSVPKEETLTTTPGRFRDFDKYIEVQAGGSTTTIPKERRAGLTEQDVRVLREGVSTSVDTFRDRLREFAIAFFFASVADVLPGGPLWTETSQGTVWHRAGVLFVLFTVACVLCTIVWAALSMIAKKDTRPSAYRRLLDRLECELHLPPDSME